MKFLKTIFVMLSLVAFNQTMLSQKQMSFAFQTQNKQSLRPSHSRMSKPFQNPKSTLLKYNLLGVRSVVKGTDNTTSKIWKDLTTSSIGSKNELGFSMQQKEPFFQNKRNLYSSVWAFASLNYLYADIVGLMDAQMHAKYETGVVDGIEITPQFLTYAGIFMQVPLANVFLPHVIKNDRALRWVQIASGTVMSLVQAGTLFAGKPSPYYVFFSAVEVAATTFITVDALKWKPL